MFATFMICVRDFPYGEVSLKVGVMEFGLYCTSDHSKLAVMA